MAPCTVDVSDDEDTATVTEQASEEQAERTGGRRRALLIGIGYETASEWPQLYGTYEDIERFHDLLRDTYQYREEEITIMRDDAKTPSLLWPTEENILREMHRLVKDAAAGDQLVLLYSGHSDQQPTDTDLEEEDGSDEVIISCDEKRIVDNDLKRILVAPLPPGCNLTAIFDSCHSGTLLDLPHYHCNHVWVPWLSKGKRRTKTMQYQIVRRLAVELQSSRMIPPQASIAPRNFSAPVTSHGPPPPQSPSLMSLVQLTVDTRLGRACSSLSLGGRAKGAVQRMLWDGAAFVSSPVQCDSPQSQFMCDGWCRPPPPEMQWPRVVSISSCADMQRSWEGGAGTMTTILCDYLSKHPQPTYRDLMTHINFCLHSTARQLHQWTRKAKKDSRLNSPPTSAKSAPAPADDADEDDADEDEEADEIDGEMSNFQTPELSSLFRLNMDDTFHL